MEFNDPILFKKRDVAILLEESHQVVNGKVQLQEVPDEFQRVTIITSGTWIETDKDIDNTQKYKVDYSTGIIMLDSSQNGATLSFSYYGTGIILIPMQRIWSKESNGEVTETLDEKIKSIDDRTQNMYDWSDHARLQGNYAKEMGDSAKQESERAKSLTDDYETYVFDQALLWKHYVNTYSEISSDFPNPEHGWTTLVLDTNTVYRYDETEGWVAIQKMNTSGDVYVDSLPPSNTNNMWVDLSE